MRTLIALPALAALLLTTAGCSALPHTEGEKYYLVVPNTKSPYFQQVAAGLNDAAGQLQVHTALIGPEMYDPNGEKSEFDRIAATKPAGIMVSVADAKLLTPSINSAVEAGIPVITVDSDAEDSKRLFFVGTNNYQAGQTGGQLLAEKLKGEGTVAVLYTHGQPNLEERLDGYKSALAAHPGIKLMETPDLKGYPGAAFDTAESLIMKGTKVDAFVVLEAQMGPQVSEVLKRENKKDVFLAMDELPGTLDGIDAGWITASVGQKPYTMGFTALHSLADLELYKLPSLTVDFKNDPKSRVPRFVDTGSAIIDSSNTKMYRGQSAPPAS